jgi:hypothetical protein
MAMGEHRQLNLRAASGWRRAWTWGVLLLCVTGLIAVGQRMFPGGNRPGAEEGGRRGGGRGRAPLASERAGVPEWTVDPGFREDVFTFVRLRYRSSRGFSRWRVDYPAADLNFSYRLEQLTSMKVDPNGLDLDIEDPNLFNYPFVFMIDPRSLVLSQGEAETLRRYLLGGGFLMIDDFWGDAMWHHLMRELEKVFPDRTWVSLPQDHAIFHRPFPLGYRPQVPSEDSARRNKDRPDPYRTWEDEIGYETPQPADYRAYLDDHGRIMLLICWNTDLSDGWEEEGVSQWFFENFSEKSAYPMGINIIFHALTH